MSHRVATLKAVRELYARFATVGWMCVLFGTALVRQCLLERGPWWMHQAVLVPLIIASLRKAWCLSSLWVSAYVFAALTHMPAHTMFQACTTGNGNMCMQYTLSEVWVDVLVCHPLINFAAYQMSAQKGACAVLMACTAQAGNLLSAFAAFANKDGNLSTTFKALNSWGNGVNAFQLVQCSYALSQGFAKDKRADFMISVIVFASIVIPLIVGGEFETWFVLFCVPQIYLTCPALWLSSQRQVVLEETSSSAVVDYKLSLPHLCQSLYGQSGGRSLEVCSPSKRYLKLRHPAGIGMDFQMPGSLVTPTPKKSGCVSSQRHAPTFGRLPAE